MENKITINELKAINDLIELKRKHPEEYNKYIDSYRELIKDMSRAAIKAQDELIKEFEEKDDRSPQNNNTPSKNEH